MTALEDKLGYKFKDKTLLRNALTHSSYANEHRRQSISSNERLEFLGDSVLGMLVADALYVTRPDLSEGELTRLRAAIVCESSLAEAAKRLKLGGHLKLGKGEDAGGGRERSSILADAVEAVLAAVYLDGGVSQAEELVRVLLLSDRPDMDAWDYKTALQELVQRESGQVLSYHTTDERGPDHDKTFVVEVGLNGRVVGRGEGRSKKEAEQSAAKVAIERLRDM